MKLLVPVKYVQSFFPTKRCKKLRVRSLSKYCEVNVKELSEIQFPAVFKVKTYQSVYPKVRDSEELWELLHNGDSRSGQYFTETIRRFKNKYFKPVRISFGSAISRSFVDPQTHVENEIKWWQSRGHIEECPLFDQKTSVVVNDNLKSTLRDVRKIASRFVICNGVLWEETPEPLYTYTTFGLGNNHGGTAFFVEYGRRCNAAKTIYWKAMDRDKAIAAAVKAATNRGDTNDIKRLSNPKEMIYML